MKIAIFGSTGLLGSTLCELYKNHDIKSFSRVFSKKEANNYIIDYSKLEEEVNCHFDNWKPDIVINCIALVNLENCENNISLARLSNYDIAISLANIAKKYNSYYIHISTDHYFNDNKKLHTEEDSVQIMNNYALTKYEAEKEIPKIYSNSLIVRTNILGFRGKKTKTFFEWLLYGLLNKESIHLYSNFYTSPICTNLLGNILLKCYDNNLIGVYNITSSEHINKYDFGLKTAKKFNLDFKHVKKSQIDNNNVSVKRALTLGLDVSKIENDLKMKMPSIDDTLNSLYQDFLKGKINE
ncbi:hypothetical protein CPG38_02820 [Malaciobacter marinus]|uniref:dTDP-4-dehydrorhamnose reductase family protein n=1 Tax=Malaciobacter marinus TaxID=505249 RepID=UPI000C080472|nr:SDR family oxidoreductase [Malaciobacter marinus]PHO13403.1 hypothetical protein CPG38_02820 [Malaciobacter marinus]